MLKWLAAALVIVAMGGDWHRFKPFIVSAGRGNWEQIRFGLQLLETEIAYSSGRWLMR